MIEFVLLVAWLLRFHADPAPTPSAPHFCPLDQVCRGPIVRKPD